VHRPIFGCVLSSVGGTVGPDGDGRTRTTSWWVRVGLSSVLAPIVVFFVVSVVLIMVGGFDPGNAFGVSDEVLGGVLVVVAGLLSGVIVGLFAGLRGWQLAVPAITGGGVGFVVFLAFVAFGVGGESADVAGVSLWGIWVGQSISIFLATLLTGFGLVGGALAAAAVGVLVGLGLGAIPASTPELYLVLAEYTADISTDECSGAGELSGVVEGSALVAIDNSGAEVGVVVLPASRDRRGTRSEFSGVPLRRGNRLHVRSWRPPRPRNR